MFIVRLPAALSTNDILGTLSRSSTLKKTIRWYTYQLARILLVLLPCIEYMATKITIFVFMKGLRSPLTNQKT